MSFNGTGPGPVVASGWTLLSVASVVIMARVYLRLKIQKRRFFISDVLMLAAWICGCVTTGLSVEMARIGALGAHISTKLEPFQNDPDKLTYMLKIFFLYFIPFHMTLYLCRGALLAMYLHIFPAFMKMQRIFIWVTVGYNISAFAACMTVLLGMCRPISTRWDVHFQTCPAVNNDIMFKTCFALNLIGNLLVFIIPWLVLPRVSMDTGLRICVCIILLLGLVTISFSVARFVSIYKSQVGYNVPISTTVLWLTLESNLEVVLACLPALGPYFSKMATFKKLTSAGKRGVSKINDGESGWTAVSGDSPTFPEKCHARESSVVEKSQSTSEVNLVAKP